MPNRSGKGKCPTPYGCRAKPRRALPFSRTEDTLPLAGIGVVLHPLVVAAVTAEHGGEVEPRLFHPVTHPMHPLLPALPARLRRPWRGPLRPPPTHRSPLRTGR